MFGRGLLTTYFLFGNMMKNLLTNLSMRLIHFIQLSNLRQICQKKKLIFQMLKLPLRTVHCQPIYLLSLLTHINFQILLPAILIIVKKAHLIAKKLKLNRIYSVNSNFDKRCNELKSWSLEKGCSEKMVWKQLLRSREHSRENLIEKVKSESDQKKLTSNIPVFQNVQNILQELHILLTPDQDNKKVFQDILLQGFIMVKA